jgi:hypothetical protein
MAQRLLILFLFIFSFSAYANPKPKLVVFTIHGFISDQTTFCDLKDILEEDYGDQIAVKDIVYANYDRKRGFHQEGAIDNRDMRDFTKDVYAQMRDYYRQNKIDIDTPFALITHSQGGIIGMRYVADCIHGNEFYCSGREEGRSITPKNLKYFITLSTPFWGSTAANRLKILDMIQRMLPVQQVSDLSMGSAIITYNRRMSLTPLLETNENIFPKDTEVVTVSADFSQSFLGSIFKLATETSDNDLLEHDLVVPMFSANIDYHFKIYPETAEGYALIGRTNMGSYYYPIKGYHAEYGFLEGLACVKRQRDENRIYKEDTVYLIVRKHFDKMLEANKETVVDVVEDRSRFVTDLQTFNLEVKFNLPKKDAWFRKIYFQKKHIKAFSYDPLIVDLSRKDSWLFHIFRGFNYDHSKSDLNYVTYYHTAFFERGYFDMGINPDFSVRDIHPYTAEFGLDVRMPWFKPIRLTAPVSPANTTFVEYNLEPIDKKILEFKLNPTTNRLTTDNNQILAIQDGLLSTRVFQFNRDSSRGSIEIKTLPKDQWLEKINAKNKSGLDLIHNECYRATVASNAYRKENYYLGFYDKTPEKIRNPRTSRLQVLDKFRVIGRFAEGKYDEEEQVYEKDRVLVTSQTLRTFDKDFSIQNPRRDQYLRTGYYWVETKDVRLIEPCSTEDFQPE